MQTKTAKFNFGWGKTWTFGFIAGGVIFLALSIAIYVFLPSIKLVAFLLLVFGIILIVICVLRPQKEFRLPLVNVGPRY
jgi:hypothetical protein